MKFKRETETLLAHLCEESVVSSQLQLKNHLCVKRQHHQNKTIALMEKLVHVQVSWELRNQW